MYICIAKLFKWIFTTAKDINHNLTNDSQSTFSDDFVRFFLYPKMTLKKYLEINSIKATPNQRSKIGLLISKNGDSNGFAIEEGLRVKDYKESFLNNPKTQSIIINHLTK